MELGDFPDTDLDESAVSRLSSSSTATEDKDTELRTLRNENKRLSDIVKEYKILLTMYRSVDRRRHDTLDDARLF